MTKKKSAQTDITKEKKETPGLTLEKTVVRIQCSNRLNLLCA